MKAVTVTIYKGSQLIAKKKVKTMKEENAFIRANYPAMKMATIVKEGWKIFRSY